MVRCLWPYFDSRNVRQATDGFLRLRDEVPAPLLLDLSTLRYANSMWPPFLGGMGTERDLAEARSGRWVLIGLSGSILEAWRFLGLYQELRLADECPDCGGSIRLEAGACDACGPYEIVEWGPDAAGRSTIRRVGMA